MVTTIAFIGNSFVEGVGDTTEGGWTRRVTRQLTQNWNSIHKGIGGDNIRAVLNRFQTDALSYNPQIVVVEVGINDSRIRSSLGNLNEVPPWEFSAALVTFNSIVKARNIRYLLLMGLTPVDEARTTPYKEDKIYLNREIRLYDKLLQEFTISKNHVFVPLYDQFAKEGGATKLTVDGVHPSPEGHALIAENFQKIFHGIFPERG